MNLLNATGMAAGYTLGLDKDAREWLVVVVKGTFLIPKNPQDEPLLAPEQVPLVTADMFTGEPGFSAPVYESDYAPRKPRCDVLLNGSAYAPSGRPVDRVTVSLRVHTMRKSFDVVGDRVWQASALSIGASAPKPFMKMPISYDRAFGGVDKAKGDPATWRFYPTNHVGVGWHDYLDTKFLDGTQLPNTEETGHPIRKANGTYRPMAFGPVGRAWQPRPTFAGTYDQNWIDNVCPFLPADFRDDYFQSAPADQQIDHPVGDEEVVLENLTPRGYTAFKLPKVEMPIEFSPKGRERKEIAGIIDTLLIEPDLGRFIVVWRASFSLQRNIFEVPQALVGRMSRGWYSARAGNKQYFVSLAAAFGPGKKSA
jgi:hypothetical protein